MNESPRRDLESLDSKDANEIAFAKHLGEFNSPNLHDQSQAFLCNVSQVDEVSVKDVAGIPCVDVDGVGSNFNLKTGLDTIGDMLDSKKNSELDSVKPSNCITHENHPHFTLDFHKYGSSVEPETNDTSGGVSSPQTSQIDHAPSESPSSTESVDINSEADESMNESNPSSPVSDIAENGLFYSSLNGCGLNHCVGNSDMDDTNMEVVLHPDYVIYQDNYYMGSKLTFSQCCIQISNSTACEKQGSFNIEWPVEDLIDIKSQLFQSSGMVLMKLCVMSSNANRSNHVSCTSGIEELKVAMVDYNWSLRHKQITSLNEKYLAIWNTVLDLDVEGDENVSRGPRCYFPNFQEPFDEVVYPKGDPDAVSLSKRDVDLLQPDTFINDTIIDFYIQYLKNKIQEEEKSRFHFFNSFFFRKLADMDKNPSSASDGKAAFLRVRKWTRKVKLFEKDYIFIPVNFNLHWTLIVICHPGEVVNFNDKELDKSLKVPCILHMDSIKGSHSGLKNLVQSYLWEEWKERHKDTLEEDLSTRFFNMRFLPLALPQQENSFDCGLFLLHYLELFLAEAPSNFNPFKLTKFSNFLNVDWFLPAEAYLKRTLIQRLIFELVENNGSHEITTSDCSDDDPLYIENDENRTGAERPEVNSEPTTSLDRQGIEITLLTRSSSLDPQSLNNSGLVLKEFFEPGATAGTILDQCQSFDQRSSDYRFNGSMLEEDSGLGEQFMYLTTLSTDPNFQQVAGITPQADSLSYLPRDCGDETIHRPEISLRAEQGVVESSLAASTGASDDSRDIRVTDNCPVGNEPRPSTEAERGEKKCSTENPEHFIDISSSVGSNLPIASVTEISQYSITKCDGDKHEDLHCFYQETPTIMSYQVIDTVACDDGQINDGMAPDICEEQAAKRRRLMPLESRSEGMVTESNL